MRAIFRLLPLLLVAASCPNGPSATITTRPWNWTVSVPPRAPDVDASVSTILYAGGTAREITPDLTVQGLSGPLAEVRLTTVQDRQPIKVWRASDVPADGHLTDVPTIPASAVRLTIGTPAGVPWPTVIVNSITTRDLPATFEEGALAVAPGETLDTVFDSQRRPIFLKVTPLGHDPLDLVAFGAGDVTVGDPATSDFVPDPAAAWAVLPVTRGGARTVFCSMLRIAAPIVSGTSSLNLTWMPMDAAAVEFVPDLGHARLVIRSVKDAKLAFPARDREAFFEHWFGVDRDGVEQDDRNCASADLACKANEQLDKLECSDWNNRRAVVTDQLTGARGPTPGPPLCYDGHRGTDFGLRGAMIGQAIGVDVTAALAGVVVFTDDGHPDDCFFSPFHGQIRCADVQYKRPFWDELNPAPETPPNVVAIRQDDGRVAWYLHLRQGSVSVFPGQSVVCGQKLGQVGSAGNSSGPHLHYELRGLRGDSPLVAEFAYKPFLATSDTVDPFPDHWASFSDGSVPGNTCPP